MFLNVYTMCRWYTHLTFVGVVCLFIYFYFLFLNRKSKTSRLYRTVTTDFFFSTEIQQFAIILCTSTHLLWFALTLFESYQRKTFGDEKNEEVFFIYVCRTTIWRMNRKYNWLQFFKLFNFKWTDLWTQLVKMFIHSSSIDNDHSIDFPETRCWCRKRLVVWNFIWFRFIWFNVVYCTYTYIGNSSSYF